MSRRSERRALAEVEERRRRVKDRLAQVQAAYERDVARAYAVRDAALGVLGVVGLLLGVRSLARRLGGGKRRGGARKRRKRS